MVFRASPKAVAILLPRPAPSGRRSPDSGQDFMLAPGEVHVEEPDCGFTSCLWSFRVLYSLACPHLAFTSLLAHFFLPAFSSIAPGKQVHLLGDASLSLISG